MNDLHTAVCALRGHVVPAAGVRSLDGPLLVGADIDASDPVVVGAASPAATGGVAKAPAGGDQPLRLARCLRCDSWQHADRPGPNAPDRLPPLEDLHLPRRDKELRTAIVMRVIAVERGIHSVLFTLVAVLAFLLRVELAGVQGRVRHLLGGLTSSSSQTGNAFGGSFLVKEGNHLLAVKTSTLTVVIAAAVAYAIVEGVEAVGLWRERRWAEYLTVLATVGFIPYEISELAKGISVLKVGALVINLVILVYLLWSKELFGIGRFRHRHDAEPEDPWALFVRPGASAGLATTPAARPDGGPADRSEPARAP
ncbi:MAG: DUF2127 domain-containing protein [Actinomycetota bacterium]|nr:DUF2127 domain-containing protein [Actinomycetota bacterium]